MFCGTQWSKIRESEVQRVNRIYDVKRAERSDSGVRVQRALRIFEKFIHIIPFLVGFLLLYLIFQNPLFFILLQAPPSLDRDLLQPKQSLDFY